MTTAKEVLNRARRAAEAGRDVSNNARPVRARDFGTGFFSSDGDMKLLRRAIFDWSEAEFRASQAATTERTNRESLRETIGRELRAVRAKLNDARARGGADPEDLAYLRGQLDAFRATLETLAEIERRP